MSQLRHTSSLFLRGTSVALALALSACSTVEKTSQTVVETAKRVVGIQSPVVFGEQGDFVGLRLVPKVGQAGSLLNVSAAPGALGEQLYFVDGKTLRQLDVATLKTVSLSQLQDGALLEPTFIAANPRHLLIASERSGNAYKIDRITGAVLLEIKNLNKPRAILELSDGSLLIAEYGSGEITMIVGPRGESRRVLATGLIGPSGMVATSSGIYITETETGSILRLDPVSGRRTILAQGFKEPHGIALTSTGRLAVLEVATQQVLIVDPVNGSSAVRFNNLPIDSTAKTFQSLAASGNEILYFGSSRDGAIYQLRKK